MFSSSENGGGWWFIIIILLILLWNGCGGNGWGRNNCGGGGECAPVNHAHQTELLANKMDNLAAMGALQRQADQCATNARLAAIEGSMLKAPPFTPFGGMPTIGCANVPTGGCGCGGWGFQG